MEKPHWISERLALAIHDRQLAEHGGLAGVRDAGLLSSALARPQHLFAYSTGQPQLARLAASYAYGIVKNHPFVDGNTRTAHVVYRTFLELNGIDLTASRQDLYLVMIQLAEGILSEDAFSEWLQQHIQPLRSGS